MPVVNPQEPHVFFVDDDSAIRMVVQRALKIAGMDVDVFACAENCLAALPQRPCDVIITELRLEGMDGLAFLQEIRRRFPWLRAIVVTAYGDIPSAVAAMRAGAADFLEKPVDRQELVSAVKNALKGTDQPVSVPREPLSNAEIQVLRLMLEGQTCREIGITLDRSIRTIEQRRRRIVRKLGIRNSAQLAQRLLPFPIV
jgi:FixJ family two-component response regulator